MSERKTAESRKIRGLLFRGEPQRKEHVLFAWDASRELVRFAAASRAKTDGFKLKSSVYWPIKLETSHACLNCARSVFRPLRLLPSSGNNFVLQTVLYRQNVEILETEVSHERSFKTNAFLSDR